MMKNKFKKITLIISILILLLFVFTTNSSAYEKFKIKHSNLDEPFSMRMGDLNFEDTRYMFSEADGLFGLVGTVHNLGPEECNIFDVVRFYNKEDNLIATLKNIPIVPSGQINSYSNIDNFNNVKNGEYTFDDISYFVIEREIYGETEFNEKIDDEYMYNFYYSNDNENISIDNNETENTYINNELDNESYYEQDYNSSYNEYNNFENESFEYNDFEDNNSEYSSFENDDNLIKDVPYIENTSEGTYKKIIGSNNEYTISNYKVDMVVNEDNTFDITETIVADFDVSKHGIFRKIPLSNKIQRLDGTTSKNRAQITNIEVNENFTTYAENGHKVLKIGDANTTLTGKQRYEIKYNYNIGKDPLKDADELYFNLIGNEWDTTIDNVSFRITMPKEFDKSTLGFSLGEKGATQTGYVNYNVSGNVITGNVNRTLDQGEGLTVRLTLPEGYFSKTKINIDEFSIIVIGMSIAFVFIGYIFWKKYGKDEQVIEIVEFYPLEGYNSAELAYLYEGTLSDEAVISLLIELANKGYLKIEDEGKTNSLFSFGSSFTITKLKEYDGNNENERLFFNGLFKNSRSSGANIVKAKQIIQEAKQLGETISFKDALEMSMSDGIEGVDSVTPADLYNRFYRTITAIKSNIDNKENKAKIFETAGRGKQKWIILMMIAIFVLITIKPIANSEEGLELLPFALLFPGIGFTVLITMVFGKPKGTLRVNGVPTKNTIALKVFGLVWGGMFGGMPWAMIVLPALLADPIYLITYAIGIICILILMTINKYMPKRTDYGNEVLGKIRGFKRFLETAEKEQLERLVVQNPEYFYNILPYTYALGVSDIWISQFESIAIQAPNWYYSPNGFNMYTFGTFMTKTMNTATSTMSASPSSSSSGGGSSGGGSSGGGSGGGGGGSW